VLECRPRFSVGVGDIEVAKSAEAVDAAAGGRKDVLYRSLLPFVHDQDQIEAGGKLAGKLAASMLR
jgi:hypothetical protein